MSYQVWFAYMLACWVISISPGAGAIASMSSGLNYGFRHGYWNALGLQLALLVQIAIVAVCDITLGIPAGEMVWRGLPALSGIFTVDCADAVD